MYRECTRIITDTLQSTYRDGFNGTAEIVRRAWGSNSLIGIIRQEEIDRATNNDISGLAWTERMGINRETAASRIRATIVRGLHEGESYAQMAERLNQAMGRDVPNAIRIIRTECYRVFSEARKDRLDRLNGIPMMKQWITSKDERVRKSHIPMHGKKVPYKDNFILPSGNQGFAPGQIGVAEEDIHCRCFWVVSLANEDNNCYVEYATWEEIPFIYTDMTSGLSDEEKAVLRGYTGNTAYRINSSIRQDNIRRTDQAYINQLEDILSRASLPEKVVLHRGTTLDSFVGFENTSINNIQPESLIGTTLRDRAFVSTGIQEAQTQGREVVMRINAPQGYQGLYIEPVATPKYKHQKEVLLQRDCYFRVTSARIENEVLYLEVDL